jgi:pimeloyl-ACP methyl ester carboxylesterase
MPSVTSADGTTIAYETTGGGPPVILVDGALGYRALGFSAKLADELADRFTVYTYDRRGRGESGDTPPYAVEREVEDIAALIEAAGGSAHLYGISSGAGLALEAANRGVPIERLALFEIPMVVDSSREPLDADYRANLDRALDDGDRGEAVRLFMRLVGVPAPFVFVMRFMPAWSKLKASAHTLPYDQAILGDTGSGKPLPEERTAGVRVPTLAIGGGKSPEWMRNAMVAVSDAIPTAEYRTLEGQMHNVKAKALAPVLAEFFARPSAPAAEAAGTRQASTA